MRWMRVSIRGCKSVLGTPGNVHKAYQSFDFTLVLWLYHSDGNMHDVVNLGTLVPTQIKFCFQKPVKTILWKNNSIYIWKIVKIIPIIPVTKHLIDVIVINDLRVTLPAYKSGVFNWMVSFSSFLLQPFILILRVTPSHLIQSLLLEMPTRLMLDYKEPCRRVGIKYSLCGDSDFVMRERCWWWCRYTQD